MDAARPDSGFDCDALSEELGRELYQDIGTCTIVIRMNHDDRRLIGWAPICGSYSLATESDARTRAEADTGYGSGSTMLNPATPEDAFVFYESPGDFGGAAAVSARSGLSVFGGSIVWHGRGDITHPDLWRDADSLAPGCGTIGETPGARGYDLVGGELLSEEDIAAALDVAMNTIAPGAIWWGGYLFDAVVLRYPRTVGAFDPTNAEWIVLLNGGYLE